MRMITLQRWHSSLHALWLFSSRFISGTFARVCSERPPLQVCSYTVPKCRESRYNAALGRNNF